MQKTGYKKNFFVAFRNLKGLIYNQRNLEAGNCWLSVREYMLEGSYSGYKYSKELADLLLAGYKDSDIAERLGIEEATLRVHKRNQSQILYSIYGDDFLDLLEDFSSNRNVILERMSIANVLGTSGKAYVDGLFPLGVLSLVKNNSFTTGTKASFNIQDCSAELSFLSNLRKSKILEDLSYLNGEKIEFILRALELRDESEIDKSSLVKLIGIFGGATNGKV